MEKRCGNPGWQGALAHARVQVSSCRGWTLIELMLVIAIIAILCSIAVPAYWRNKEEAEDTSAEAEIRQLTLEIDVYLAKNGKLPKTLDEIGRGTLLDPWGNPYQYLPVKGHQGKGKLRKDHFLVPINSDYDLYSMGPDGQSTASLTAKVSRDDIIRANDGAFFGVAEDY